MLSSRVPSIIRINLLLDLLRNVHHLGGILTRGHSTKMKLGFRNFDIEMLQIGDIEAV